MNKFIFIFLIFFTSTSLAQKAQQDSLMVQLKIATLEIKKLSETVDSNQKMLTEMQVTMAETRSDVRWILMLLVALASVSFTFVITFQTKISKNKERIADVNHEIAIRLHDILYSLEALKERLYKGKF